MAPTHRNQTKQTKTRKGRIPSTSANKILKSKSKPKSSASAPSISESNPKPKRRPGRPFKMPPRPDSQPQCSQPSSSVDAVPPPRRLSMIEVLPVEVIEKIFLYALNPNLARASPSLGAAVSSERIYRLLILLAFWEDPAEHSVEPVSPAVKRILSPVDYEYIGRLPGDRRSRLQAQLFDCKWLTMDRLLEQVPTMMVLTIHRKWLDLGVKMEPDERAAVERFMKREDDSILKYHGTGPLFFHFAELTGLPLSQARQLDRRPFHVYQLRITPMAQVEIISESLKIVNTSPALHLCCIPNKLLRGSKTGFTQGDVDFLEMLRITSNNYKHLDTKLTPCTETIIDRTALHEGVTNAIQTQNYNALISLLKFDEFVYRYKEVNQDEPVYYTIPAQHFVQVTRVGRRNPSLNLAFFEALIRASAESVPASSPETMAWAIDNAQLAREQPSVYTEMNGRFARWLADFMLRLPDQVDFAMNDPNFQLFNCGHLQIDDLEGCRFLEEVLMPNRPPLENWTAESAFFSTIRWVKKAGPPSSKRRLIDECYRVVYDL